MEQRIVKSATSAITDILQLARLGEEKLWVDYDKEADVLYMSFGKPQKADHAQQEQGIIVRKRKSKVVGITVLNASKYASKN